MIRQAAAIVAVACIGVAGCASTESSRRYEVPGSPSLSSLPLTRYGLTGLRFIAGTYSQHQIMERLDEIESKLDVFISQWEMVSMPRLKTVTIVNPDDPSRPRNINLRDYRADQHTLWEDTEGAPAPELESAAESEPEPQAESEPVNSSAPPAAEKRGRGRPRKVVPEPTEPVVESAPAEATPEPVAASAEPES